MRAFESMQHVAVGPTRLPGILVMPPRATGLVLLAYSGAPGRFAQCHLQLTKAFNQLGLATLQFDLLNAHEQHIEANLHNMPMLVHRIQMGIAWARQNAALRLLPIGLFGEGEGAAALLTASVRMGALINAIVCFEGRIDVTAASLVDVAAPTLLIVGGADLERIALTEKALDSMSCEKALRIVPGTSDLFDQPGALRAATSLAGNWFHQHLQLPSTMADR